MTSTRGGEEEDEIGVTVKALEGSGSYHVSVDAIGTVERLSREVVLSEPGEPPKAVLLEMDCDLDDACTFTYDSLQMRGDGGSFTLKFKPTAGFTYRYHAQRCGRAHCDRRPLFLLAVRRARVAPVQVLRRLWGSARQRMKREEREGGARLLRGRRGTQIVTCLSHNRHQSGSGSAAV